MSSPCFEISSQKIIFSRSIFYHGLLRVQFYTSGWWSAHQWSSVSSRPGWRIVARWMVDLSSPSTSVTVRLTTLFDPFIPENSSNSLRRHISPESCSRLPKSRVSGVCNLYSGSWIFRLLIPFIETYGSTLRMSHRIATLRTQHVQWLPTSKGRSAGPCDLF